MGELIYKPPGRQRKPPPGTGPDGGHMLLSVSEYGCGHGPPAGVGRQVLDVDEAGLVHLVFPVCPILSIVYCILYIVYCILDYRL